MDQFLQDTISRDFWGLTGLAQSNRRANADSGLGSLIEECLRPQPRPVWSHATVGDPETGILHRIGPRSVGRGCRSDAFFLQVFRSPKGARALIGNCRQAAVNPATCSWSVCGRAQRSDYGQCPRGTSREKGTVPCLGVEALHHIRPRSSVAPQRCGHIATRFNNIARRLGTLVRLAPNAGTANLHKRVWRQSLFLSLTPGPIRLAPLYNVNKRTMPSCGCSSSSELRV